VSTANGLASSANNSANTVSNGNNFTVGNQIQISDNSVLLALLLLFCKCRTCCNCQPSSGSTSGCTCGTSGTTNLEGIISKLLDDEKNKQQRIFDMLNQNNSIA